MKRIVLAVLSATFGLLIITVAAAAAGEVTGTVKKVDAGKNTVVVTVDGKDKTFKVNKDASFISVTMTKSNKGKVMETVQTIDTLAGIQEGSKVVLLTEIVDGKEVVRAMKVDDGEVKGKAKTKKKKKAK